MGAVAKRYAEALFETAKEKNILDQIEQELNSIARVLDENPLFLKLLHSPRVDQKVKKQEFNQIFADQLSETMMNFMNLLIDRHREDELESILAYYTRQANAERGIEDATVTSLQALSEEETEEIKKQFGALTKKQIRIQNVVDPSILGGIIVKIGDRLYDGSVAGKLQRFKRRVRLSKS